MAGILLALCVLLQYNPTRSHWSIFTMFASAVWQFDALKADEANVATTNHKSKNNLEQRKKQNFKLMFANLIYFSLFVSE